MQRNKLRKKVKKTLSNRMLRWKSLEDDAPIICDVVDVLVNRGITVDRAASILRDSIKIIPMVKEL